MLPGVYYRQKKYTTAKFYSVDNNNLLLYYNYVF